MFYQMKGILNNRIGGKITIKDSEQNQMIIIKVF